jgi:hypothetical protein
MGWNVQQFQAKGRPTQAELQVAAPHNPMYVQLGYGWAVMTPTGFEALHIAADAGLPTHDQLERDAEGADGSGAVGRTRSSPCWTGFQGLRLKSR